MIHSGTLLAVISPDSSMIFINNVSLDLAVNGIEFVSTGITIAVLWAGSHFVIRQELTSETLMLFYSLVGKAHITTKPHSKSTSPALSDYYLPKN